MKTIIKLTILIFLLTIINDIAFSKSVFESHEYKDIIDNSSSNSSGMLGKKVKVILSVGELGQFTMGHFGTYSNLSYGFAVNPETRFEVNGHLGAGFALGAGGSMYFRKLHDSTTTNISYRWSVGPSLYIFFAMKKKVRPYFGFVYFYNQSESLTEVLGVNSTTISTYHSMEGSFGLCFMAGPYFGICLTYTYVYDIYISSTDTGGYHKAGMGFKVFL